MVVLRQADEVMSSGGESAVIAPTATSASTADTAAAASANQVTTAASLRLDDFDDGQPLVWQAAERTITPMFEIAAAASTSASVSKSNSELSVRYAEPTTSRFVLSRADLVGAELVKKKKEERYSLRYFMPKPYIRQKIYR